MRPLKNGKKGIVMCKEVNFFHFILFIYLLSDSVLKVFFLLFIIKLAYSIYFDMFFIFYFEGRKYLKIFIHLQAQRNMVEISLSGFGTRERNIKK